MVHLYNLGNLGVLSSVFIGDLHGITSRGNCGITAVETSVMGNGFSLSRRKRGYGDSCLEMSTDYRYW